MPRLAARPVMSSIRCFPQGALDCDPPLFAKNRTIRGSGISTTLLRGLAAGLPGLAKTMCLILEGTGVPLRLGVLRGESQLAPSPRHSWLRKICSSRKAWRSDLSGRVGGDLIFPLP